MNYSPSRHAPVGFAKSPVHQPAQSKNPMPMYQRVLIAIIIIALVLAGILTFYALMRNRRTEENTIQSEEYAQVCQDSNSGLRVDDSYCEAAGSDADFAGDGSVASASPSSSSHSYHRSSYHWYYVGGYGSSSSNSTVPSVGSRVEGGSYSKPSNGTVYSGVSTSGGSYESSYKSAKKTSTRSSGKTTSTISGGKTSSNSGSKSGSNSGSNSGSSSKSGSKSGSKSSGSKGGFGGGSKSGGGSSGG
ncbi:MAG: hypothetical protein Q4P78_03915 [Rothia sp. (in: high G+C Gram-positive bacteria)]|uniref:hypothetical protein n=1 Tax=Rothia sp. (in: high G+C Gram-positive bacteria) TaxID=1885016 RepID=UPI0026DED0FF|nr:hypothetical protein [Rothia sp. (in: high G+C Gram-positive bacteria)]MDO5750336.1 hypothetical protein [Rothia sp. (in: high G+C Gram-positive bacteria)]